MNTEITVKSEKIFEGKIINLRVDTVELEDKKYTKREIVEHRGASAILAANEENEIILVRQYRKAVEDFIYEIPAGTLNIAEEPVECALRELEEETGYKAENLVFTSTKFDEDEFIETVKVSKEEAEKMIKTGRILDGKTLVGILYWLNS